MVNAELFGEPARTFTCKDGTQYKMSRLEAKEDPGHYIYDVDTDKVSGNAFDCDAKADMGMKVIGLNCFPVSKEASQHRKPSVE